jgi:hypothetical protein
MNAITQIITQELGGSAARTIAQRFGISETAANSAIQIAVRVQCGRLITYLSSSTSKERLRSTGPPI